MENHILQQILDELKELKQGQVKLEQGQAELKHGQKEIRQELKYVWDDIKKLDQRLTEQENYVLKRIK